MNRSDMTPEEQRLADEVYACIQDSMDNSPRSQQAQSFVLGVSDLGTCRERTRRLIQNIPMADPTDKLEAFCGTWVGEGVEKAILARNPWVVSQVAVSTVLHASGSDRYQVLGHPDLVFPWGVADVKSVDGLEIVSREGPNEQQLFQRHIYTKGASEAGLLSVPLEQAKTANIWIDRSGSTHQLHVHMDDYQPEIVTAAALWLEDVFYAADNNMEAEKTPPRQWCRKACGHYRDCRQFDTDVEGLITDRDLVAAAALYDEGSEMYRTGDRYKKEAKKALAGIDGWTREHQIRWIHVNGSEAPDGTVLRRPHSRLEVTRISQETKV